MKQRKSVHESELHIYWLAVSEARAAARAERGAPTGYCPSTGMFHAPRELEDAIDELEVMGECTDWPALRSRCLSAAASLKPVRRTGSK